MAWNNRICDRKLFTNIIFCVSDNIIDKRILISQDQLGIKGDLTLLEKFKFLSEYFVWSVTWKFPLATMLFASHKMLSQRPSKPLQQVKHLKGARRHV